MRSDLERTAVPFVGVRELVSVRTGLVIIANCLAILLAHAASAESYQLRYGLVAGQTWHAVQTTYRETTVAGLTRTDRGTAHFRYDVAAGAEPGDFRLDARMLSQTTQDGESPFDFSVIHFVAQISRRGALRGMHFQLGDAEPPPLEGLEPDPVAFRQMLRSVASAWLVSVYWLPELPDREIAIGDSFVHKEGGDVGGTDPGVAMQIESTTAYTLRGVTGHIAHFEIEVSSTVDAATALAGIVSERQASGEALFDLEHGMWIRHETRSEHRASVRGAGSIADQASGHSVTTIEMKLGEPPEVQPPMDRVGL